MKIITITTRIERTVRFTEIIEDFYGNVSITIYEEKIVIETVEVFVQF